MGFPHLLHVLFAHVSALLITMCKYIVKNILSPGETRVLGAATILITLPKFDNDHKVEHLLQYRKISTFALYGYTPRTVFKSKANPKA